MKILISSELFEECLLLYSEFTEIKEKSTSVMCFSFPPVEEMFQTGKKLSIFGCNLLSSLLFQFIVVVKAPMINRGVFRTLSNIYAGTFREISQQLLAVIFAKHSILFVR